MCDIFHLNLSTHSIHPWCSFSLFYFYCVCSSPQSTRDDWLVCFSFLRTCSNQCICLSYIECAPLVNQIISLSLTHTVILLTVTWLFTWNTASSWHARPCDTWGTFCVTFSTAFFLFPLSAALLSHSTWSYLLHDDALWLRPDCICRPKVNQEKWKLFTPILSMIMHQSLSLSLLVFNGSWWFVKNLWLKCCVNRENVKKWIEYIERKKMKERKKTMPSTFDIHIEIETEMDTLSTHWCTDVTFSHSFVSSKFQRCNQEQQ